MSFREIPGFEAYEINREGVIRRRQRLDYRSRPCLRGPLRQHNGGVLLVPGRGQHQVWKRVPELIAAAFEIPIQEVIAPDDTADWCAVAGYEREYEITRDGRVRRIGFSGSGKGRLGGTVATHDGAVRLTRDSISARHRIIDLVSVAFGRSIDDLLSENDLPGEEWRPIFGHEERHEVSNMGRVRRRGFATGATVGRILQGTPIERNRFSRGGGTGKFDMYVCLSKGHNGSSVMREVARLVCFAFHGRPQRGMEANHKNGDTLDNRAENLEWLTKRRNVQHAWENGLTVSPRGLVARHAKLTADQVREIRALRGMMRRYEIAERYGVSTNTISRIHVGRNYSDVV